MGNFKQTKKILKMRTVALAVFAAATTDAEQQTACNAYLWGLEQAGWTCTADATDAKVFACTNTDTALNTTSNTVDSTSASWVEACVTDGGDVLAPKAIKGTTEKCDAWLAAKVKVNADYVVTAADKKTLEWATACNGLDGAASLTAFGDAVVAAIAALAF